jgi:preprotein translocase subunit SecD
MVDKSGKETVMPMQTRPALTIQMRAEDAKKFSTLTKQAVGKRVLLKLGDTPLIAPMVQAPISTPSLILTLGGKTDKKKVEDELKKLVR